MPLTPEDQKELDAKLEESAKQRESLKTAFLQMEDLAGSLCDSGISAQHLGLLVIGDKMIGAHKEILKQIDVIRDYINYLEDERVKDAAQGSKNVFNAVMAGMELQKRDQKTPKEKCVRCGNELVNGKCSDSTCPFHAHQQHCKCGWLGHPDRPDVTELMTCACSFVCPRCKSKAAVSTSQDGLCYGCNKDLED